MSDQGSISGLSSVQDTQNLSGQNQTKLIDSYRQKCADCLKSSVGNINEQKKIITAEAVEKLDLLQKTSNDENIKNTISTLTNSIKNENNNSLSAADIQKKIELAFQNNNEVNKALKPEQEKTNLENIDKNPFKPDNPFAPKAIVIQPLENIAKPQNDPKKESQKDKEKKSTRIKSALLKKINSLLSFLPK